MDYQLKEVKTVNNNKKEINKEVTIVDVNNLMPYGSEVAIFNGFENNANVSFFLVCFSPGVGPKSTAIRMKKHS